jgi:hypothetical protein
MMSLASISRAPQWPATFAGEQCLRPVDRPGKGCTFPVTVSSLKQ